MKAYTIGALFSADFKKVLLILKQKPQWQKGKLNFPGGSIEEGETAQECISREFMEETGLVIDSGSWQHIGKIDNPGNYYVDFLTSIHYLFVHGEFETMTEEEVGWYEVDNLPTNIISNLA